MTRAYRLPVLLVALLLALPGTTLAQSGPAPAMTTAGGDTGLWLVSTADTLPRGRWSTSLFRSNIDRRQGLTDVSHIGLTGAVGLSNRVEVFGSWRTVRLDRDVRPLFVPSDADFGGVEYAYPHLRSGWSKTLGGPLQFGAKLNLLSESRDNPVGVGARVALTAPTGPPWGGTDAWDTQLDLILSREVAERLALSGMVGGVLRQSPPGFELPNSARWGVGASFPSRSRVRALVEVQGEAVGNEVRITGAPLRGDDGSLAPLRSRVHDPVDAKLGLVWQVRGGAFVHAGANYSSGVNTATVAGSRIGHNGWGFDVRLGFHPGTARRLPPPPPAPAPPPPPAPANRAPAVQEVSCDPCTVLVGQTSTLRVKASDPEGAALTYAWSAPTGTIATRTAATTIWTAPQQVGSVPVTVTVTDPQGLSATGTVTLQVVRPPVKEIAFEDVHFDFDRYTLRPDALRVLDEALATLRANPDLRITVEGHTCNIGTAEYNLALGERRSRSVYDYLVSRGVTTSRLDTVSYGEERPKHDNGAEATRRLNRRAALTVTVQ